MHSSGYYKNNLYLVNKINHLFYFQLKLFSQQLQHINPTLKNELFVIDWTLLLSVRNQYYVFSLIKYH